MVMQLKFPSFGLSQVFLIKREYEDHDGHYDHYKTFGIQIKQMNISETTSDEKTPNLVIYPIKN